MSKQLAIAPMIEGNSLVLLPLKEDFNDFVICAFNLEKHCKIECAACHGYKPTGSLVQNVKCLRGNFDIGTIEPK